MSWTSSERLMYVKFTCCAQGLCDICRRWPHTPPALVTLFGPFNTFKVFWVIPKSPLFFYKSTMVETSLLFKFKQSEMFWILDVADDWHMFKFTELFVFLYLQLIFLITNISIIYLYLYLLIIQSLVKYYRINHLPTCFPECCWKFLENLAKAALASINPTDLTCAGL